MPGVNIEKWRGKRAPRNATGASSLGIRPIIATGSTCVYIVAEPTPPVTAYVLLRSGLRVLITEEHTPITVLKQKFQDRKAGTSRRAFAATPHLQKLNTVKSQEPTQEEDEVKGRKGKCTSQKCPGRRRGRCATRGDIGEANCPTSCVP